MWLLSLVVGKRYNRGMKINRLHAILGFLLVIIPLTDFSRTFKYGFAIITGAIILFFAIQSIHRELHKKHRKPIKHDTFVESKPVNPIATTQKENSLDSSNTSIPPVSHSDEV